MARRTLEPRLTRQKRPGLRALIFCLRRCSQRRAAVSIRLSWSAPRLYVCPRYFQWPEMAEAGAVPGYGPPIADVYRQRARLTAKVLRGAKPVDLPVEQPTKFELVINLKTSKAIGHEVPAGLVLRADKVIE